MRKPRAIWVLALSGMLAWSGAVRAQTLPVRAEPAGEEHYYPQPATTTPDAASSAIQAGAPTPAGQLPTDPAQQDPQEQSATPAVEKSRRLSRTFAVSAGRPYFLDTRYGRVQVNVWARPEIRTDVEVITRADTDEKAQQLQDMIQVQVVENDAATGGVAARSRFGTMPHECWSRNKRYEVNYTVWLPKNTPLHVSNTFGEVSIVGDLTGATDLSVAFGTLRTGRLESTQNVLRIDNGQAAVPYVRRADIAAYYSRLRLDAGQAVDLRNNYSDIDIGTVQDLAVHSKYGDVALGTVRNLRGTSGYSTFSIDKLADRLDMTVQYCPTFEVRNTGRNFRQINLDGGYSTFLLNFSDSAGFDFDVNTQHGQLLVDKKLVRVASEESGPASSDMQGSFGAAKPRPAASNVNIRVRYGNVRFSR